jgi:glutamate-1-semialdehyde 2,1-aminomutase
MTTSARDLSIDAIPGDCFGTLAARRSFAFIVSRGQGSRVTSTDGRTLIDFVLGSGPMVIGHAHPRVVAAVQEQAARGTSFYAMNDVAPRLAARIVELVPCADAVKFVGDGAEATFYSLRLARGGHDPLGQPVPRLHGKKEMRYKTAARGADLRGSTRDRRAFQRASAQPLIAPYNDPGYHRAAR